jgi:hypothetical protein
LPFINKGSSSLILLLKQEGFEGGDVALERREHLKISLYVILNSTDYFKHCSIKGMIDYDKKDSIIFGKNQCLKSGKWQETIKN